MKYEYQYPIKSEYSTVLTKAKHDTLIHNLASDIRQLEEGKNQKLSKLIIIKADKQKRKEVALLITLFTAFFV